MRRRVTPATGLVAGVLVLSGSSGCSPAADPELVGALEGTGLVLYEPRVRGAGLRDLTVDDGVVRADLDGAYGRLREAAYVDDGRPLCRALRRTFLADSSCTAMPDAIVADFEEMVTVAVVRGGTVLALSTVDEGDPDLVTDVLEALREAPVVTAEELAREAG